MFRVGPRLTSRRGGPTLIAGLLLAALAASCAARAKGPDVVGVADVAGTGGVLVAGGASATQQPGLTEDTITLSVLADISGPVPGLFQGALDGMKAWAAYINSTGGIDGRKVELMTFDTNTNATEHRIATKKSCNDAFAIVGGFSVADNGGAAVGEECGIPTILGVATSALANNAKNTVSPVPIQPNKWPTGPGLWIKENYPEAIKRAAFMGNDHAISVNQLERARYTLAKIGFNFVYEGLTPQVEANLTPYVLEMKSKDIGYFSWSAERDTLARILKAMDQQNWRPEVRDFTSVVYHKQFLELAGDSAEGVLFPLTNPFWFEADKVPELKLYLDWLEKTSPGAEPDIFGVYAWASGVLFEQAVEAAGDDFTREQVLAEAQDVDEFTARGLLAPTSPKRKEASTCFAYGSVKDGEFVRVFPEEGYDCRGEMYVIPEIKV